MKTLAILAYLFLFTSSSTFSQTPSIEGTVWYDDNLDGCRSIEEDLASGFAIWLYECTQLGNGLYVSKSESDSLGQYSFTELDSTKSYYLDFDIRGINTGYRPAPQDICDELNDSDLSEDKLSPCIDFSNEKVVVFDAGMIADMTLGGVLFLDTNANGVGDVGEKNIGEEGIQVYLDLYDATTSELVSSMSSNANGSYYFYPLLPGDYYLEFMPPARARVASPNAVLDDNDAIGDNNGSQQDNNADGITDGLITSSIITLSRGEEPLNEPWLHSHIFDSNNNMTLDFGLLECKELKLEGTSFEDINQDGCFDVDEPSSQIPLQWNLQHCYEDSLNYTLESDYAFMFRITYNCATADKEYFIQVEYDSDDKIESITSQDACIDTNDSDFDSLGKTKCFSIQNPPDYEHLDVGLIFTSSVLDLNDKQFSISPNPISSEVHITSPYNVHAYQIRDISGKLLIYQLIANSLEFTVNLSHLEAGTYLLDVITENGPHIQKVIKN